MTESLLELQFDLSQMTLKAKGVTAKESGKHSVLQAVSANEAIKVVQANSFGRLNISIK